MRPNTDGMRPMESQLAHLLDYGTWIGTLLIAVGLVWPAAGLNFGPRPMPLVTLGVIVLIALPVIRVLVMLWNFVRTHERRFALLALLVLVIVAIGLAIGIAEG
ncbi:MAG TPA: DUF1634 domain-containing protein [Steroidobacteraceae bacterium]|jgi:hypothetical protein